MPVHPTNFDIWTEGPFNPKQPTDQATLGSPDRKAELSTLLLLSYFVARYRNLGRNYSLGKV